MILLACIFISFVGGTWYITRQNDELEKSSVLYPFSGYLTPSSKWTVNTSKSNSGVAPTPDGGLFLVGMKGGEANNVPQIQCPVGSRINIVGAYLDIADPYSECSNTPNPTISLSCGDASNTTTAAVCKVGDASGCGPGMSCPAGKCVPKTCTVTSGKNNCGSNSTSGSIASCPALTGLPPVNGSCNDPTLKIINGRCMLDPGSAGACMVCVNSGIPVQEGGTGVCSAYPACSNVLGGLNSVCSPTRSDLNRCRPRDASAYLGRHCDGKNVCLGNINDIWTPNSVNSVFGPLPCEIPANNQSDLYASLPISTGWAGGSPISSASGQSSPATFTQGYYVHGIYTCVPESQDVVPK